MPYVDKGTHGRGRCRNCRKLFQKKQVNQLFCGKSCKAEYHAAGGTAFDKLLQHIDASVRKQVAAEWKAHRKQFVAEVLQQLESPQLPAELRAQLGAINTALSNLLDDTKGKAK